VEMAGIMMEGVGGILACKLECAKRGIQEDGGDNKDCDDGQENAKPGISKCPLVEGEDYQRERDRKRLNRQKHQFCHRNS